MPRANFSLWDRFRYRFDNTMSQGVVSLIAWLLVFAALLALLTTVVLVVAGLAPADSRFTTLWWETTQRVSGLSAAKGSYGYMLIMAIPMFGSMFVGGLLVGLIVGGVQNKLRDLRKGRSRVAEHDHTVILGWSPQIFTLLAELVKANASRRRACITILAEMDKTQMEDEVRTRIGDTRTTSIVCRTGVPTDPEDLKLVNPAAARAFIILPSSGDHDAVVIKTLLALAHEHGQATLNVVAQMKDERKMAAARLIGTGGARLVHVDSFLSRITVQASREAGLSVVYQELLDFAGSELYIRAEPALTGKSFGDALLYHRDATVMGLQRGKRTWFNPPMDTVIEATDRVVLVAEDDDKIHPVSSPPKIREDLFRTGRPATPAPERTLCLGWNQRSTQVLADMDAFVAPGSEAVVVADRADVEATVNALSAKMKHQKLSFRRGDVTDGAVLEQLQPHTFHHVIVIGSDTLPATQADEQSLITLLQLRDVGRRFGEDFTVVSEMADPRNRVLAGVARADDFILSEQLVSQLCAQLSENPELSFDDLFDPHGSELYLKSMREYVALGEPLDFGTVIASARRRGEVAIGYRLAAHAHDVHRSYGVVVNPPKDQLMTFGEKDKLVVLAEA